MPAVPTRALAPVNQSATANNASALDPVFKSALNVFCFRRLVQQFIGLRDSAPRRIGGSGRSRTKLCSGGFRGVSRPRSARSPLWDPLAKRAADSLLFRYVFSISAPL